MRDDFIKDTKERLALRVCMKCSICVCPTSGPADSIDGRVQVGVAAHIRAASKGGPRFDDSQSSQERRSIGNGIWLCQNCAKKVDDDEVRYTVESLTQFKCDAESRARIELGIAPELRQLDDWASHQLSRISSFEMPFKFPLSNSQATIADDVFETFSDQLHHLILYAFGHACITTPFDDFVYVLTVDRTERSEDDRVRIVISIHCHVTEFIWAFQELWQYFIERSQSSVSNRMRSLPGDQRLDLHPKVGKFIPHRISRSGAKSVRIQQLADAPIPMEQRTTTSTLLRVLSFTLNCTTILWENADKCPDWERVILMLGAISDGNRFSWDDFRIERSNPESWEYDGSPGKTKRN